MAVLWSDVHLATPWIALRWASLISDTLAGILRYVGQRMIPTSRAEVCSISFSSIVMYSVDVLHHVSFIWSVLISFIS